MDMTAVSAAMSVRQAVTQQAIGTAVTKLAMNQQQQSGQMVVDLLKSASPAGKASLPHLGQNIDISICFAIEKQVPEFPEPVFYCKRRIPASYVKFR